MSCFLVKTCLQRMMHYNHNMRYMSTSKINREIFSLQINGHLFDTSLINDIFNVIQNEKGEYNVIELQSCVNSPKQNKKSNLVVEIDIEKELKDNLINKLNSLIDIIPNAEATMKELTINCPRGNKLELETQDKMEKFFKAIKKIG